MEDRFQQLANNLRKLRKSTPYSQQNVAEFLGVTRSTYTYYESGRVVPSIRVIASLSRLYRVKVEEIIPFKCFGSDEMVFNTETEDPMPFDVETFKGFNMLSQSEQSLIMMFRASEDKAKFYNDVKKISEEAPK
ncbi:MAG: helix-turn-helix domain-containing protein [Clostridiales bacterium]|nr:helix-turn-helix domain-containing protein [Clostridiales bacterium]